MVVIKTIEHYAMGIIVGALALTETPYRLDLQLDRCKYISEDDNQLREFVQATYIISYEPSEGITLDALTSHYNIHLVHDDQDTDIYYASLIRDKSWASSIL